VKRAWDVPPDVRTVHLCACTLEHAEEIGASLEALGIAWWVKPPSAGFLAFLDREHHVFVDRTRQADAAAIARDIIEPQGGDPR
jgi:hypothetical protein